MAIGSMSALVLIVTLLSSAKALSTDEVTNFNAINPNNQLVEKKQWYELTIADIAPAERDELLPDAVNVADAGLTYSKKIKLSPAFNASYTHCLPKGTVGYAKNGAAIFKIYAGRDPFNSPSDPYSNNGFNFYLGHSNPIGLYHYHQYPDWSTNLDTVGNDADFVGIALDGFPIYGPNSLLTDWTYDSLCNGYYSGTAYRYVLQRDDGSTTKPPVMTCYRGTPLFTACDPTA